jgi:hypothetical protein
MGAYDVEKTRIGCYKGIVIENHPYPTMASRLNSGFVCVSRGFTNAKEIFAQNRNPYCLDRGIAFLEQRLKGLAFTLTLPKYLAQNRFAHSISGHQETLAHC